MTTNHKPATPLPSQYVKYRGEDGPHYAQGHCLRCGKKLRQIVQLELDQRVNEYHNFGGVPDGESQGWFEFGPDCAEILCQRARALLRELGEEEA